MSGTSTVLSSFSWEQTVAPATSTIRVCADLLANQCERDMSDSRQVRTATILTAPSLLCESCPDD